MNDIDMYIDLFADEKEINRILKLFDFNIRSNNLDLKKMKIKTMIRTNQPYKKSKKSILNPFTRILRGHKVDDWDCLSEKEFFITLNKNIGEISDYVKFANLLLKYPDDKNKYIEMIESNRKNKKYAFDFNINFDSEKEITDYYSKLSGNQEYILNNIKKYFLRALKLNLFKMESEESIKDIKKWDMSILYNSLKKDNEAQNSIMKFDYLITHEDMDKSILNQFCIDICLYLISVFENSCENVNTSALEKLQNKADRLQNEYKQIEKDYKDTCKKLKNEILINKVNKSEMRKYEEEIKKHSDKNSKLSEKINEINEKVRSLTSQLKEEKDNNKDLNKKITNTELYYEYSFPKCEATEKIFGFIYSMQIDVVKTIFGEVEFIYKDDWIKLIDKVKKIYIQREGISTKELLKIKNYCAKQGIKVMKSVSIHDEKSLIESIAIIKNK